MPNTVFIYALCEPGTRTVRYIGKTTNLKRRFREHIKESIKFDSHLGHWLSLLVSRGEQPEMIVFREVAGDGSEAEKRYIRLARGCRMRLVNCTDGGEGISNMSLEIRDKIRVTKTGSRASPETRAKMSAARLGEKNHNFGRAMPLEQRMAISVTKRGCKNPHSGHVPTLEARANMSAAWTPEKRAALGAKQKARIAERKKQNV